MDYFVMKRNWTNWMLGRGMAERTIGTYAAVVRNAIDTMEKSPLEVTENDVLAYVNAHAPQGAGRNTVIQGLKSFFTYLSDKGIIEENPTSDLRTKKAKYGAPRCLTKDQLDLVIAAADAQDRRRGLCMRLLYLTGIRVGSAAALKPGDVDLENDMLHVRRTKGDRPYQVPMSTQLKRVAIELLELHDPNRGPFLLNVKDRTIWMWCKEAGIDAGIAHVHPHLLRHSFATHLLQAGANIEEVRLLLNHQSLAVTQIYLTVDKEELRTAASRLSV